MSAISASMSLSAVAKAKTVRAPKRCVPARFPDTHPVRFLSGGVICE